MEDKVKRIYDAIKFFKDNINEIWGPDIDIDEMLSENNSTRREEIFKKYFSFLSEYLLDPALIPSLKLEKIPKDELLEILIVLELFLPKNIYHDIFKYYKDKIDYLNDFSIVISKDDVDFYLSMGYTIDEIIRNPGFYPNEELMKYVVSFKTTNGVIDKEFYDYIINNRIDGCLFLVLEDLRKGNHDLLIKYTNTKKLVEALLDENLPDTQVILDKILLLSRRRKCSSITDMEKVKKLISLYGPKYIVFASNPSEELLSMVDDFNIEDYISINGDYHKSPHILKLLLNKGEYEALEHAKPEAITQEIVELLVNRGINLKEYERRSHCLERSLAYNKYLVSQGRYEHLRSIHDLYTNLESFDYVYSLLKTTDIKIKSETLDIIYYLLGKKDTVNFNDDLSQEVAEKVVSLGFTLEDYLKSPRNDNNLLQAFIRKGDVRALLILNSVTEKEISNITYEDFLSIKSLKPKVIINKESAMKLIKEGHYDVFEHVYEEAKRPILRELGLDDITEEQYDALPEELKELRILKDKFVIPPTEDIMDRLEKDPNTETISLAVKANIPYKTIVKCIEKDYYGRVINYKDVIKFLQEGHLEAIKYLDTNNISKEEQIMAATEYYKRLNGEIPDYDFYSFGMEIQNLLIRYYISQGKYEIVALQEYVVTDPESLELLKKRKYSIEDFRKVPIFNTEILKKLVKEGYIDDVKEAFQTYPTLLEHGEDFLTFLYRSKISKDKISYIAEYCRIDMTSLIIKLKDSELELLQYLNLETLLQDSDTLTSIIDNLDPEKIEKVLQRKVNIPAESLKIIISNMVEKGNPRFVRFYQFDGEEKVLKKALLAGYMPKIDTIENSQFLSSKIPSITFTTEEKDTIKTHIKSNPRFVIYILDDYEKEKSLIIDCIMKEPEIFQLITCDDATKKDIVEEIAKKDIQIVATLFNNISEEERVKLVESSHEIVTYLPNNLITEKICRIVVDDYPEVIDKRGSLPSDIIKQAFEHGYKVNEKSSTSAISYAIQNNKPIPAEIWNEKNFEKLFKSIETVIYEAHLEKLNILFDEIYKIQKENLISAIMSSTLYKPTVLRIIGRYGYTSVDYETIKNASSDSVKMYFLISLKALEKLSPEDQKSKIAELFAKTGYKKECLEWLKNHNLSSEANRLAKDNYASDPLVMISYIQDQAKDEKFIEKTKELIRNNPKKFYSLANNVPEILLDKEIVKKIIIYDTKLYKILPVELKKDKEIIDIVLDNNIDQILDVPIDVPNYKDLCYKALSIKGQLFSYLLLMHKDKEALKKAVENYPDALNYADISIIDDDIIKSIKYISSINLETMDIEKTKRIISLKSFDTSNIDLMTKVLNLVLSGKLDFTFDKKIAEGFIVLLNEYPDLIYKNYFELLLKVDETLLTEEQIKIRDNAKQLLEEYGKVNTLEKNKVFSYELVKHVVPGLGLKKAADLMKYNSEADKIIIDIIKAGELDLAKAYIELVQKYHIFEDDDKLLHFAFKYFESCKPLIKDIIGKDLTPEEVSNLTKIIMNNNPYNVKTKEELTRYEEVVEEYAKEKLKSSNLYDIREYFVTVFGFTELKKFESFFRNYQLDNFPQINYALHVIKKRYGEDIAKSLSFTVEEVKVILLMKEVLETKNIDELKQLIRLGIATKGHVLDYSDIVHNITLKVRKLYNYQINASITKIDSLKEKQKSKTSEQRKTIIDYRGQQKEATYTIIDMDEEPFNFIVHRLHNFDPSMIDFLTKLLKNPSLWTKLDGASTLSTSSISERGFWFLDKEDTGGVVYIFDELPEGFLLYMYCRDLMSQHGGHTLEPTFNNNRYTDLNSLNQITCSRRIGLYNEVVGYRAGVMPKAILCTALEPNEDQVRAADYFGIPIIRVNMQKYETLKESRYKATKESMSERTTLQGIYDVMYNGIVGEQLETTINFCIDCIRKSYKEGKSDFKEMLKQLLLVRQLANRISEPENKQIIRKVDLIIHTIALEKSVTEEEIIELENANMGETGIMYKAQEGDKEFLLKPAVDKKQLRSQPYRAEVQKAVSKLQKIISPDTAVTVEVLGKGELRVAKQEKITLGENKDALHDWVKNGGELDPNKKRQLLQEYVVDFLACNFDCFVGNFVVDSNDNVRGVDKEQSFRFIDDIETLDPSFSYVPNGSSRIPIYQYLFQRYQTGEIDLDFSVIDKAIAIIEEMTDIEYEAIFRQYAESRNKEHPEIILEKIVQRKHICIENMKEYIANIRRDNPTKEGETNNGKK